LNAQNVGNGISVLQISKISDPLFMRGMSATHVAFSRSYPPLIYYLTERSLFEKSPPPTGKSLKKALSFSVYIETLCHPVESRHICFTACSYLFYCLFDLSV
jgi:hypothetical protein